MGAEKMGAEKMGAEKGRAKKIPTPSYWILFNYERRWLGMMTKMKKMNVLIYQVTRFARDNRKWNISTQYLWKNYIFRHFLNGPISNFFILISKIFNKKVMVILFYFSKHLSNVLKYENLFFQIFDYWCNIKIKSISNQHFWMHFSKTNHKGRGEKSKSFIPPAI